MIFGLYIAAAVYTVGALLINEAMHSGPRAWIAFGLVGIGIIAAFYQNPGWPASEGRGDKERVR
jgi:hypothetical protein